MSSKERTLTLQSAGPDDSGLYSCCARSAVGSVCSHNNFTLSIVGEWCPSCALPCSQPPCQPSETLLWAQTDPANWIFLEQIYAVFSWDGAPWRL